MNSRKELAGFARDYAPVTLDDLDRLFETGTWHKDKPGLIPVFYEGYRNSATVAAPLCDEFGLTGWFPIATSFVDCDPEHQEAFARAHWISLVEEDTQGGRIAMNWDEVHDLSRKHVIYPHTAHHEGFDTVLSDDDIAARGRRVEAAARGRDGSAGARVRVAARLVLRPESAPRRRGEGRRLPLPIREHDDPPRELIPAQRRPSPGRRCDPRVQRRHPQAALQPPGSGRGTARWRMAPSCPAVSSVAPARRDAAARAVPGSMRLRCDADGDDRAVASAGRPGPSWAGATPVADSPSGRRRGG